VGTQAQKLEEKMGIDDLLGQNREDILRIAAQHGASNVRIFGSFARGEARPDSDVDFLVELESERSLLDHVALIQDLSDLLGRKVDVATDIGLRECIRERILNEAVSL